MTHPCTRRARSLRSNLTDAERLLWRHIRRRQLNGHKFRRQYPIGPYFADFACVKQLLVVELDGGQHAEHLAYDRQRDRHMQQAGFRVLRYWNHLVIQETEAVLEDIRKHLLSPP